MSRTAFVMCVASIVLTLWVTVALYFSWQLQLPDAPQIEPIVLQAKVIAPSAAMAWQPNTVCFPKHVPKPESKA